MMRKPGMALLIAASAFALAAIMLLPAVLAPAPAQADNSPQPRVQGLATLILQQPRLQLATPEAVLREPRLQLATPPPVFRRAPVDLLPRWDRQYIVPTPEPQPNIASCGDTLQGVQWTRITAPAADAGGCFVTIQARPGSTISFTLNPVLEGVGLQVQVVDIEGQELFSGETASPQSPLVLTYTSPPSGEVTLAVNATEEGEFEITPQRVYYIMTTPLCGGPLQAGMDKAGFVQAGGEECWYQYAGQRGHVLTIRMTTDSTELDPYLKLYDQAGDMLTTDDDSGGGKNAELAYILPASQKFTIIARDYNRSANGQFQIEAIDEVPPPTATPTPRPTELPTPAPAGGGGQLRLGVPVAGVLSTPAQKNVYTFSGTAGQTLKITLVKTSGNLDTYLELYGPNYPSGARLAYSDDNPAVGGRNSQINSYRLNTSGPYKIVVSSYAGRSTGAYRLTVARP